MFFLNKLKANLVFLLKFTRFLFWAPTVQQNLTAALLLILLSPANPSAPLNLMVFLIIQFFMFTYTFVVNDVGDKTIDIKAGKIKPIQQYSTIKTTLIISLFAAGSLIFPLYYGNLWASVVSVFTFLLLTFYSLKPIRFKERGLLGPLVADVAQRSLLFLIFALSFSAQPLLIAFFMGWLFLIGFQDELNHQLADIDADEKSGALTWVQRKGRKLGEHVLIAFLAVSLLYLFLPFLFLDFYSACLVSITLFIFRAITLQLIYGRFFSLN